MIFDDSLSAIDKISKKNIINSLMDGKDNNIKIFITHNLSLAPKFNKIIFLDKGKVYCSTHDELLNNINYKKLYELSMNNIGDEYD